ncbi:MAG TPA: restriction endonuclease [Kofleriaceae bacterium]|nr:restriction endonuclease [Kofleriaceae bacterium]
MAKKKTAEDSAPAKPKKAASRPTKPAAKKAPAKKPSPRGKKDTVETAAAAQPVQGEAAPAAHDDVNVEDAVIVAETIEPALTEEERELTAIYGDDASGTPAVAHVEYSDRQTRDEDRPMMPEINAREERKHQWQERRDRRKQRRDERQQRREGPPPQHGQQPQQHGQHNQPHRERQAHDTIPHVPSMAQPHVPRGSSPQLSLQMPINGHDHDALARVGTPLGDAAAAVFAQLRNGQPLPVRQLAAMMRKRSLVTQDPEQLWPQLKAELLGDERSYRTLGLRPRIVYRGRDLFAPGPVAMSATAEVEAAMASALSKLAGATHRALAQRIAKASAAGFERLIHAFLVAAGYREIDWIKRVGGISYATAQAPGLARTVLISSRSGDQAIDRRGIGELRVGVEAKNLVAGILFAPRELSEDAEQELERAGRSISVMCGDSLVAALIAAGVGVVSAAAPVHYLDDQLLEELLAG